MTLTTRMKCPSVSVKELKLDNKLLEARKKRMVMTLALETKSSLSASK